MNDHLLFGQHSIDELELRYRTRTCLLNDRIETIEQLKAISDAELLRMPNFGKVCLSDVHQCLAQWHRDKFRPWVPVVLPGQSREAIMVTAVLIEIRDALRAQVQLLDRIQVTLQVIMEK